MEKGPFYGFIRKQETPLEQETDSTVAYFRGEMMRIAIQSDNLEDLKKYGWFFPADKGFRIAIFSRDEVTCNRYKIDEILEEE